MSRLNCSIEELANTINEYFRAGGEENIGQRLGQYIWNRHGVADKSFPELFYTRIKAEAIALAYKEIGIDV